MSGCPHLKLRLVCANFWMLHEDPVQVLRNLLLCFYTVYWYIQYMIILPWKTLNCGQDFWPFFSFISLNFLLLYFFWVDLNELFVMFKTNQLLFGANFLKLSKEAYRSVLKHLAAQATIIILTCKMKVRIWHDLPLLKLYDIFVTLSRAVQNISKL